MSEKRQRPQGIVAGAAYPLHDLGQLLQVVRGQESQEARPRTPSGPNTMNVHGNTGPCQVASFLLTFASALLRLVSKTVTRRPSAFL